MASRTESLPKNAYTKFGVPNYVDELPQDWQWGWIRKIEPFVLAKPGKGYRVYQYMTLLPGSDLTGTDLESLPD